MISTIELTDQGSTLVYTFDDVMLYHGPGSPGGVAHAARRSALQANSVVFITGR